MHPIENIIDSSIDQIKKMVDVSTVIGDPVVTTNETLILPVSKVCIGFVVGGGEYGRMATAKKAACIANESKGDHSDDRFPFAGTAAVGMCLTPLSFVTVEKDDVRVLPAAQDGTGDRLMDILPRMLKSLERLMNLGIDCIKHKCECSSSDNGSKQTPSEEECGCDPCYCHEDEEDTGGC